MNNYYPFGMPEAGRSWSYEGEIFEYQSKYQDYTYGYNGMQRDNSKGLGSGYTTLFREYDPEIARWKSLDPKLKDFQSESPFSAMGNNPIMNTDVLGDAPLNGKEARVYFSNDGVRIRVANCYRVTQSAINNYVENVQNWHGNIGANLIVTNVQLMDEQPIVGTKSFTHSWDGSVGSPNPTESVNYVASTTRTGNVPKYVPNQYKPKPYGGGSSSLPIHTKGVLLYSVLMAGVEAYQTYTLNEDFQTIKSHINIAREVMKITKKYTYMIPPKYQNKNDLNTIMNVIMTGENFSSNKELTEIGNNISRKHYGEPIKLVMPIATKDQDNTRVSKPMKVKTND